MKIDNCVEECQQSAKVVSKMSQARRWEWLKYLFMEREVMDEFDVMRDQALTSSRLRPQSNGRV